MAYQYNNVAKYLLLIEENTKKMSLSFTSIITISSPYSTIYNYNEDGIHWAYLSNVCMNMNSLELMIFQEKKNGGFEDRLEGYQHLWKFKKHYRPFPEETDDASIIWNEEGAWMIIPGWSRHTSHFSENIMMVNHRASNPSSLPPVKV